MEGVDKRSFERLLFHGIRREFVDTICLNNFDWRTCGVSHGIMYGQGKNCSTPSPFSLATYLYVPFIRYSSLTLNRSLLLVLTLLYLLLLQERTLLVMRHMLTDTLTVAQTSRTNPVPLVSTLPRRRMT